MTRTVPPIPSDPGLPGARGLFGPEGPATVEGFLADRGWSAQEVQPVQAMYSPGRSLIVRYRASAERSGQRRSLTVCAERRVRDRGAVPTPEGFESRFGVVDPVTRMNDTLVWAYPYDPSLSGLPDAAWGPAVGAATERAGRSSAVVSVQPLRYRPRRRAVFRYRVLHRHRRGRQWESSFGKVLPQDKADRLAAASPALEEARRTIPLAVPAAHAGDDMLLIPSLPGQSLRDLLVGGGSLPSPARVAGLPAALNSAVSDTGVEIRAERPDPIGLARSSAKLVAQIAPHSADEARRVVDAVRDGTGRNRAPTTIVHGDLYEAQVIVGDRFSLGLIDLDDLSRGDPALDAANFCAHLLALALAVPSAADRLVAYRRLVRPAFERALDLPSGDLAWREALCMLLLASGPFRVLDPAWPAEVGRRVALAVRLLEEL
jgi:hypothetical protein